MKKTIFYNTNPVAISSRLNEYMKSNFGYAVAGDVTSLREAKSNLEAQKRDMKMDHQNRAYVENMLMLETVKSLLKAHVVEGELPPGLKAYQDKKNGKKSASKDKKAKDDGKMPMDAGKDGKMGTKDDKPAFLKKEGVEEGKYKSDAQRKAVHAAKNESADGERPYVVVHVKKGKTDVTASSSYAAATKAAKKWGLKSTAGVDAYLADIKHVAETDVPKVDVNSTDYGNSYKGHKEYNMKREQLAEGLLAQLNTLLESDAAEAEVLMAARGIADELQDMIEKIGKIQNDQLGPLTDEMVHSHGQEAASVFKDTADQALSGLMQEARTAKDAISNATLVLSGDAPADDMSGDLEIGGDIQDDFVDDVETDFAGGDESMSGPDDEPLGRAKRS